MPKGSRLRSGSPVVLALAAALAVAAPGVAADSASTRILRGYAVDGDTVQVNGGASVRVIGGSAEWLRPPRGRDCCGAQP